MITLFLALPLSKVSFLSPGKIGIRPVDSNGSIRDLEKMTGQQKNYAKEHSARAEYVRTKGFIFYPKGRENSNLPPYDTFDTQISHDLLRHITLPAHLPASLRCTTLKITCGSIFWGMSRGHPTMILFHRLPEGGG
jgi:hypothetical protein